jgi:hypothetical protein
MPGSGSDQQRLSNPNGRRAAVLLRPYRHAGKKLFVALEFHRKLQKNIRLRSSWFSPIRIQRLTETDMQKRILLVVLLVGMSLPSSTAWAASVEGRLASIDAESRRITVETGEMWNLTELVVLDGLEPGQLVRVTYTDETIDATAVDILEPSPPVEPIEVPVVADTEVPVAEE